MKRETAKVIVITGTPGVGKSTLARFLRKKYGWRRLDLHKYYPEVSTGYDHKKKCYILNFSKVKKLVLQKRDEDTTPLVIDSHVAHHLPPKIVDLCVVLKFSELHLLKRRLQQRGYSPTKVAENMQAEIFQICLQEAQEEKHKLLIFDKMSSDNITARATKIKRFLK
ncbi:AAA family ATPase [Candidatus Woesearchaeota archaeon]|nr:AAA family ATPase [Candidatus Woesearchaeota archaeon]